MFNGFFRTAPDGEGDARENLQPRFQSVLLNENDFAVSKRLDEIKLIELNVEVIRCAATTSAAANRWGDMILRAGDVLVLLGQPLALITAEKRLHEG
ncbi:MAG: hypothetical protein WDM70_09235 [Nitrosomonadales bacterium]